MVLIVDEWFTNNPFSIIHKPMILSQVMYIVALINCDNCVFICDKSVN